MQVLREDYAWLVRHAEDGGADGWRCRQTRHVIRFVRVTLTLVTRGGRLRDFLPVHIPQCINCKNEPLPEKGDRVLSSDLIHISTPDALRRRR